MDGELLADQPLGQKLIKKGFWLYFFMILTAPVGYLIRVIISNELSVMDVGLFYSVLGFVTLISIYNDLGLTEALQYFLPKYRIEKKYNHYKTILYLTIVAQVVTGIIIAGAMWLGSDRLAIYHFHSPEAAKIIKIFCRYFIGINFVQVFNSIYISFQDAISSSWVDFSRLYVTLAFTIFFWLTGFLTRTSFSIAWIAGIGISIVVSGLIFFKKYGKTLKLGKIELSAKLLKSQLNYAIWVFLGANIGILFTQMDQQLIINFLGPEKAGYYANFGGMFVIYSMIVAPILSLIFPIVIELVSKKEIKKFSMFQDTLYKYFSIFVLSISGLFFALGPEIATMFFGAKFAYSGVLISYAAPFFIFFILFSISFCLLAGIGKIKERVKIMAIAVLINVLSNIILIRFVGWGLIGGVISLILSWIVLGSLGVRLVNKNLKVNFDRRYLLKNLLVIFILSSLYYILKSKFFVLDNVYRYSNIVNFFIAILIYYGIIGGVNYKNIKLLLIEIKSLKNVGKQDK